MSEEARHPDIVLILRPLKDPDGVSVAVRVRALLKYAGRYQFLKCVRVEGAPSEQEQPEDETNERT